MGKLYAFVLGLAVGVAVYHVALHYHVVYAADGVHWVAKAPPRLAEAYVDIRGFTPADWANRPQLALAVQQAGLSGLVTDSVSNAIDQGLDNLLQDPRPAALPR